MIESRPLLNKRIRQEKSSRNLPPNLRPHSCCCSAPAPPRRRGDTDPSSSFQRPRLPILQSAQNHNDVPDTPPLDARCDEHGLLLLPESESEQASNLPCRDGCGCGSRRINLRGQPSRYYYANYTILLLQREWMRVLFSSTELVGEGE